MKLSHAFAAAMLCAAVAAPAAFADHMPMDRPVTIDGVATVCTGIGAEAQHDPRWLAYPIRVEFANDGMQYLAGAHVELKDGNGKSLFSFDCSGAWVLFQLPAGQYEVFATLLHRPAQPASSASFSPPATGQMRVVLEFPGVRPND